MTPKIQSILENNQNPVLSSILWLLSISRTMKIINRVSVSSLSFFARYPRTIAIMNLMKLIVLKTRGMKFVYQIRN